jgi:hypothetical protein
MPSWSSGLAFLGTQLSAGNMEHLKSLIYNNLSTLKRLVHYMYVNYEQIFKAPSQIYIRNSSFNTNTICCIYNYMRELSCRLLEAWHGALQHVITTWMWIYCFKRIQLLGRKCKIYSQLSLYLRQAFQIKPAGSPSTHVSCAGFVKVDIPLFSFMNGWQRGSSIRNASLLSGYLDSRYSIILQILCRNQLRI